MFFVLSSDHGVGLTMNKEAYEELTGLFATSGFSGGASGSFFRAFYPVFRTFGLFVGRFFY